MAEEQTLISINQAVAQGIDKVRMLRWANVEDHLKIDLVKIPDGRTVMGPWLHLYSPVSELIGMKNPQDLLNLEFDLNEEVYVPYVGEPSVTTKSFDDREPLEEDEEYCNQCNGTGVVGERETCFYCEYGKVKKE